MNIKELVQKYNLTQADCWNLQRGGRSIWILTHDACERIASQENINVVNIECLTSSQDLVRYLITANKGDVKVITTGEAGTNNCTSNYYGCMAEKRGIDRAVLKLIKAYEYGIYSETESDDFRKDK